MILRARNVVWSVAILCVLAVQGSVLAQSGHSHIIILHIESVLAADTNQGIDPELGIMGPRLKRAFRYSTYHLVSEQNGRAEMGKMVEFTMPGGRILHVEPHAIDGNMIAMEVLLFQGEKPMFDTEFKLPDKSSLIIGGPRYEEGELIISIGANMAPEMPPAAPE